MIYLLVVIDPKSLEISISFSFFSYLFDGSNLEGNLISKKKSIRFVFFEDMFLDIDFFF